MEIIFVLLPLSLLLALGGVGLYLWAVRSGQLDDLDTPALRVLFDDAGQEGDTDDVSEIGQSRER